MRAAPLTAAAAAVLGVQSKRVVRVCRFFFFNPSKADLVLQSRVGAMTLGECVGNRLVLYIANYFYGNFGLVSVN